MLGGADVYCGGWLLETFCEAASYLGDITEILRFIIEIIAASDRKEEHNGHVSEVYHKIHGLGYA